MPPTTTTISDRIGSSLSVKSRSDTPSRSSAGRVRPTWPGTSQAIARMVAQKVAASSSPGRIAAVNSLPTDTSAIRP